MSISMASSLVKCLSYKEYDVQRRNPNPEASALLVIDAQNYFSSMAKPILHSILPTISLFRRASIPVFFRRHCHKSPADHGLLYEWSNGDLILDGTPESELITELDRLRSDAVIEKVDHTPGKLDHARSYESMNSWPLSILHSLPSPPNIVLITSRKPTNNRNMPININRVEKVGQFIWNTS